MKKLSLLSLIILTACVSPAHQPIADAAWEQQVKSNTVPPNKSRVEIYSGTNIIDGHIYQQHSPADIIIDGVTVGGINEGEVMAIDLKPDTHSFTWVERSSHPFPVTVLVRKLKAGEIIQIAVNTDMRTTDTSSAAIVGGVLGGAIGGALVGAAVEADDNTPRVSGHMDEKKIDIKDMKIVMPDDAAIQSLK